jgi:nitrate/nitrite transporter NarK
MIVSIGNLGGFVGPYLIGVIRQSTDSFSWALLSVAAFLTFAAILIRVVGASLQRQGAAADGATSPIASLSKGI